MEASRFERVEDLFHKAKVLDAADRASFLDEACAGDLDLRAEVESLLVHADRGTAHIDAAAAARGVETKIVERGRVAEGPGTRIGPYKLLQPIGEGGFGAVYMAEQEHPVRRKVALKIIKLGMDTKQVIARFEAERQALALMDHPNIARVLDAGATETGRPYFVMELVKGIPLIDYCDTNKLTTEERLELFMDVCHAVQHAHQKGVIHRDLKPSNVLVTLHDGRPVPKVIDFGIAKATSQRLTEKTLFTEFRQFVGTPEYMSPEQAEMSGLDVDTRTDIYSLGVLLYELLTGTTPFNPETLRTAGYGEIQRIIREEEPPKPSTRVGTLVTELADPASTGATGSSASAGDLARRRRTDTTHLSRMLRGDLDWIVMKAIEKDRTRRYETPNELAADVRRHLDSQPVLAGPPSVGYKLAKFMRRHRVGMTAGSFVAATLVIGISLAMIGFIRAKREAEHSRDVSEFLQDLTMRIEQGAGGTSTMSVGEIVARGRDLFGDDHAVVGTLLMTRASALDTAGRREEALQAQGEALAHYRSAHDGDHPAVAAALTALGKQHKEHADYLEAETVFTEALAMKRRLFGNSSKLTADALSDLTEVLLESQGADRAEEIKDLWTRSVAAYEASVGPEHHKTVKERAYLGTWLHGNGYVEEAEPLLVASVDQVRRVLGRNNLTMFVVLNSLAQHRLLIDGDLRACGELVEEMVEIGRTLWGPNNDGVTSITLQLVNIWKGADRVDEAAAVLRRYLEDRRAAPDYSLGVTAAMVAERVAKSMTDWFDENPEDGRAYALLLADDARALAGVRAEDVDATLEKCGEWLAEHGFDADAESLLRECLDIRVSAPEPDDRLVACARSALGACLTGQGRFDEAEPLVIEGFEGMQASPDAPAECTRKALDRVIKLYEAWGKPDLAAQWRGRAPQALPGQTG